MASKPIFMHKSPFNSDISLNIWYKEAILYYLHLANQLASLPKK